MGHALVIEDRPLVAAMIAEELAECGYETADIAATEEDAAALASRRCPDLITADAWLREGSGVAAAHRISGKRPIPILFITADRSSVAKEFPRAAILDKPFTRRALLKALELAVTRAVPTGPAMPAPE
jgi:two-component system, response regulator PdtaR